LKRLLKINVSLFVLTLILFESIAYGSLNLISFADELCGESLSWSLNDGILSIAGEGDMYDFNTTNSAPWTGQSDLIKEIIIDENVTSIGNNAFKACGNLTSINISSTVNKISKGAFNECTELISINVSDLNTTYYSNDGVLFLSSNNELMCFPAGKEVSSYTIPEGTIRINQYAFYGCNNLKIVNTPESMFTIDYQSFMNCDNLETIDISSNIYSISSEFISSCKSLVSINVSMDNVFFSDEDGVLFNKDITKLIKYPSGKAGYYMFPSSVTSIESKSFLGAVNLTGVVLSESIGTIPSYAFQNCISLEAVENLDNISSIGLFAFSGCSVLKEIKLPYSVNEIGAFAFNGCNSLSSVFILNESCKLLSFSQTIPQNTVIYGLYDSTANTYATNYNRKFIPIDLIDTPEISGITHFDYKGIKLFWNPLENYDRIEVLRRTETSDWEVLVSDCNSFEWIDMTAEVGVNYNYAVRTIKVFNDIEYDSFSKEAVGSIPVATLFEISKYQAYSTHYGLVSTDANVVLYNGSTYAPLRIVAASVDFQVEFEGLNVKLTSPGGDTFTMMVDSTEVVAVVDGQETIYTVSNPVTYINGKLYAPLRTIASFLASDGYSVHYLEYQEKGYVVVTNDILMDDTELKKFIDEYGSFIEY